VGTLVRQMLEQRNFPYRRIKFLASKRSAGKTISFKGESHLVEELQPAAFDDVDLVIASTPDDTARQFVPWAVERGAVVVDESGAWRMDPKVPLVVPEVNADAMHKHQGIIASPNCSTTQMVVALKPLHDAAGLARVRVSTYQSVSGAGLDRMEELRAQAPAEGNLGMDWDFDGEEFDEETKLRAETRKILELPDLPVSATCVRVPVLIGHSEAVWVETTEPLSPDDAARVLGAAPGLRLERAPTPRDAAGIDEVLVGRIRRDPTIDNGLVLFIVADNLRKGAALNAIQIAELLPARPAVPA
jgi:aspartate-semialdehyde dehydrogenase